MSKSPEVSRPTNRGSWEVALHRVIQTRRRMRSIYDAMADHLRSAIMSGEIASGVKLPTERVFARRYGLARVTVRAALARLQSEGLISRRTRTGTIVLPILSHGQLSQEESR